jgi:membrane protein YqaA with SNARE-associated domain
METLFGLSYVGIFTLCLLAATLLPFSSEAIVVLAVANGYDRSSVFLVALAGNYLGSVVNYIMGSKGIDYLEQKLSNSDRKKVERAQKIFAKWGLPSLLLAWVPIIGDPLTLVAGAAKVRFSLFSLLVVIGKALRYVAIIWIAGLIN